MDRRGFLGGAIAASAAFCQARSDREKGESNPAQYVILELMGYKRLCGRLTKSDIPPLMQLDVPVEGGWVTQLVNPTTFYRVTICDEAAVRAYASQVDPVPPLTLEHRPVQEQFFHDDDDDDDDGRF